MIAALSKKLKIKSNMNLLILNAPEEYLASASDLPDEVKIDTKYEQTKYPFVQIFLKNKQQVMEWAKAALDAVEYDGLLWLSYPKKSSKLFEDLTRDEGWEPIQEQGYEAIASVAIDETWSSLRFRPKSEIKARSTRSAKTETLREGKASTELVAPDQWLSKLEQHSSAKNFFEALAPSYKRTYIEWITSAKREETKTKRMDEAIQKLEDGFKNPYAK